MRDRYRAFTVDEYQDVNLLQQTLLEGWLGSRDDLCAVGDDYQSIYGFTGATPAYLLGLPTRYPHAAVVRLERNYRSTPQVLELANRIVPRLGGAEKVLVATRGDGPEVVTRPFGSGPDETDFVVERIRALADGGVPHEQMAILCRTNARLADFEEPLHEARIPFQGASLLAREAARRLLRRLREQSSAAVAASVRSLAVEAGWLEQPPDGLGERELVRQADLGRLVALADEFDDGVRTTSELVADLERRFGSKTGAERRGVHLLTLHRAKGLEFEAVFLPRRPGARAARPPGEERRRGGRGAAAALRGHDQGRNVSSALTWSGRPKPVPRGARRAGRVPSPRRRAAEPGRPALRGAEAVAAEARDHTDEPPGLRRLPQLDVGRNRRPPPA